MLGNFLKRIWYGKPLPNPRSRSRSKPKALVLKKAEVPSFTEVSDVNGMPEYQNLLSGFGGFFEISESQQMNMAVVEIYNPAQKTAAILYTDSNKNTNQYLTLKSKIISAGYQVSLAAKVSTGDLMRVYSGTKSEASVDTGENFSSNKNQNLLKHIIRNAIKLRASDIHITPRYEAKSGKILFRIDGKITVWDTMPADELIQICGYMYTKEAEESSRSEPAFNANTFQSCSIPLEIDGQALKLRYQSVRVNGGIDVVLRLLFTDRDSKTASLEELGYSPSQVKQLNLAVRKTVGGIFIAGVTGSGKSTTLKTLMSQSPTRHEKKYYSIEDPVEYKMYLVSQIPVQRSSSAAEDAGNAFLEAMRVILRADPDVIMPGEIRDAHSCSMLKGMIQSGHQVMTSIHASSSVEIIERITSAEFGLPRQSLASRNFLSALVYQRLIPKICSECGKPAHTVIDRDRLKLLEDKFNVDTSLMKAVVHEDDCPLCFGTGTYGVTVASEIIMPDMAFLKAVRDNLDMDAEIYWRRTRTSGFESEDMTGKTAFEHCLYKVVSGVCDLRDLESSFEPLETYEIVRVSIDDELAQKRKNSKQDTLLSINLNEPPKDKENLKERRM